MSPLSCLRILITGATSGLGMALAGKGATVPALAALSALTAFPDPRIDII